MKAVSRTITLTMLGYQPIQVAARVCWEPDAPEWVGMFFPNGAEWMVPRDLIFEGLSGRRVSDDEGDITIVPDPCSPHRVVLTLRGLHPKTGYETAMKFIINRSVLIKFLADVTSLELDAWLTGEVAS